MAGLIYALTEGGDIKYIGQAKNLTKRYQQHCSLAQNQGDTPKQRWLRNLILDGKQPGIRVLAETDDLDAAEISIIKHYRSLGIQLYNLADGGHTMTHIRKTKEMKPWGNRHSPVQHILISLRQDIQFSIRHGRPDSAARIQKRYEQCLEAIKKVGKDRMNMALWEKWEGTYR